MTDRDGRAWTYRRLGAGTSCVVAGLALVLTLFAASVPAAAQPAPDIRSMCGRTGDVSQLLLDLQKPNAERLWRDSKLFVMRDPDDGSLWAFSIKNSTVHPAVRCRRPGADAGLLCPGSDAACASFATQADEKFEEFGRTPLPAPR